MLPICILTIQDEDDRAYMSRLFVQYHRLMYQCTYEVLDDKWATEDAVQTTLLRLIDRIDVVRQLDESKLPGYIAAACRHTAYNVLRHNRRHPQVPLEDAPEASSAPDMDELLSRRVELNALARVWPRLDEDTRWLLEARYILDYSDSELAREMGVKPTSLPESTLTLYDNLEFLFRILLSAALGAAIGLERTKRQKEAGVRTHCIIACASAVFMILSKYAFIDTAALAGSRGADTARIAAQVVSGISFLGAGVIFKNGSSIRGLTTAAGMWGTAAVGMAIGAGMYWLGLMEAVVLVVIQLVLHRFRVGGDAEITQEVTVHMTDSDGLMQAFDCLVREHRGKITDSTLTREDSMLCLEVSIRLPDPITHEEALRFLRENPGVRKISV